MNWRPVRTRYGAPYCGGAPRTVLTAWRSLTRDDGTWSWRYQTGDVGDMGILTCRLDQGYLAWFAEIEAPPSPAKSGPIKVIDPALPALTYAPAAENAQLEGADIA